MNTKVWKSLFIVKLYKGIPPLFSFFLKMFETYVFRSSLGNYTSNNTRHTTEQKRTRVKPTQHETTQVQHKTARIQHDTAGDNTRTTQDNTATKQHKINFDLFISSLHTRSLAYVQY